MNNWKQEAAIWSVGLLLAGTIGYFIGKVMG